MTGKMDSYLSGTLVYQVLSYIYGVDTLNNIYFSKDRNFEFFNLLSSEALTLLEYNEFLDSINAITNFGKDATNKDINNALKYLIKIYISEKGSNWYEDFVFRYCLNGISQGYIIEPSIVEFQDIRRGVMTYDIFKMINKPEYSNWISPGTILFKDDKVYFNIYVIRNSSGNDVKGLLTALFDVNKKKISSYTFSAV